MNEKEKNLKLENDVIGVINDIASAEVKTNTDSLTYDLGMDSLGMVILLTMIEDTFEIELDESDMNPFELQTVQNVIDLVAKYCYDELEEATNG